MPHCWVCHQDLPHWEHGANDHGASEDNDELLEVQEKARVFEATIRDSRVNAWPWYKQALHMHFTHGANKMANKITASSVISRSSHKHGGVWTQPLATDASPSH